MPPELVQWLPPGLFLGMSAFMALSILCEKYEPVARVFGRFGGWLRDRAAKGESRDYEHLHQEILDLKAVVKRQRQDMDRQDTRHRGDMEQQAIKIMQLELVEEVAALRRDMTNAYMQYCALWYIDAVMDAAEKGHKLLPCQTWTQFCARYREEHGIEIRPREPRPPTPP